MSKYIDAEKLIAELRKHLMPTVLDRDYDEWERGKDSGFIEAISIIESLQQEQPSLPSGLDDAAEKYSENILANNEDLQDAIEDAFKAGAEWMAGQGETREVEVKEDAGGYPYIQSIELYDYDKDEPLFKPGGDKVVVQIRKK